MCGHVAFVNNGSYLGGSLTLFLFGGVGEWFIPEVLKTSDPQGSVGSNPAASAQHFIYNTFNNFLIKN